MVYSPILNFNKTTEECRIRISNSRALNLVWFCNAAQRSIECQKPALHLKLWKHERAQEHCCIQELRKALVMRQPSETGASPPSKNCDTVSAARFSMVVSYDQRCACAISIKARWKAWTLMGVGSSPKQQCPLWNLECCGSGSCGSPLGKVMSVTRKEHLNQ
jgi:hypothetical protein